MQTLPGLFGLPHHQSKILSPLYIASTIRTFLFSFLSIFLPLIILAGLQDSGYSFRDSLIITAAIFMLLPITHGLLVIPVVNLCARLGTRVGMIFGQIFLVIFLAIVLGQRQPLALAAAFLIWGIAASFWWLSYHIYFAESGAPRLFGREISYMEILGVAAAFVAPVVAGLVLSFAGSTALFALAILLTLVTTLPLRQMEDEKKIKPTTVTVVLLEIKNHPRDFLSFLGASVEEMAYSFVWPIFLFSVLKTYIKIGAFSSLVVFAAALTFWAAGRWADKLPKEKIERFGAILVASSWLGKVLFQIPAGLFIFDTLYRVFAGLFYLPLNALAYVHAREDKIASYLAFREITYKIGNVFSLVIVSMIAFFNLPLWWAFAIAALFSLLPGLVREK